MRYIFIILLLLSSLYPHVSLAQVNTTEGRNSPIINAQDISLEYGVTAQLVYGLLNVYERQKLTPKQRLKAVQNLLSEYNNLKKTGDLNYQFTPEQKGQLGITQNQPLVNYLEWNTFLTTYGYYSPILVARGDVEVIYGLPQAVFEQIWASLEKKEIELYKQKGLRKEAERLKAVFEEELEKVADNYRRLDELYAEDLKLIDGDYKAKILVDEGKFTEAEEILISKFKELDQNGSEKASAVVAYAIGLVQNLQLKYQESILWFGEAVSKNSSDAEHLLYYGNQLQR
ncbi:MAG: hypothetical protein AAFR59_15495, partial [Bacteroidota bacterium]